MKYILTTLLVLTSCGVARAEQVRDHLKTVIIKKPYTVEVCQDRSNGSSDLENFITGAIIGGAIGNNVPGEKSGGAIGGMLGGILNAERNKGVTCRVETRYNEETKTIYSHSTITFTHEGRSYTLSFQK